MSGGARHVPLRRWCGARTTCSPRHARVHSRTPSPEVRRIQGIGWARAAAAERGSLTTTGHPPTHRGACAAWSAIQLTTLDVPEARGMPPRTDDLSLARSLENLRSLREGSGPRGALGCRCACDGREGRDCRGGVRGSFGGDGGGSAGTTPKPRPRELALRSSQLGCRCRCAA
eukprot:scaffold3330_cov128-Isochrysis_galbana.AAC.3